MPDSRDHERESPGGQGRSDPRTTEISATQTRAGIDRAGTGHGSAPHAAQPGRPDAPQPTSQRPGDQAGPVGPDGSERRPTDRTWDPSTWEAAAQGDNTDADPRVSTVPLDTDDGGQVVIEQQNAGPGQQVGAGEFKEPGAASHRKDPGDAAREQERLEHQAPVHGTGSSTAEPGTDATQSRRDGE